jgi:hypothetical protein
MAAIFDRKVAIPPLLHQTEDLDKETSSERRSPFWSTQLFRCGTFETKRGREAVPVVSNSSAVV